ncbi:major capsid protein [Xylophilus ampelinus]|uniref:Virion coat protein B n=1 Tax=Xylophilus ampelinus TaxID=54067 RepID=A0A318SLI4_9BURK|nr:major capsid protein [Xylophilus ampelinus]MCS4508778.1 major capsid protein [Xylophilus ampelinus]PYE79348.1 virion coat protein B [Xylophilus ampelinus]
MNKEILTQKRLQIVAVVATVVAMVAPAAHADALTIDTSGVVATINSGVAVVSSLGLAVLSLVVVVKLFGWVRGALR